MEMFQVYPLEKNPHFRTKVTEKKKYNVRCKDGNAKIGAAANKQATPISENRFITRLQQSCLVFGR